MKLVKAVNKMLSDHKAFDINIINLDGISDIASYMIICCGNNKRHVAALSHYAVKLFKDNNQFSSIEGVRSADWVLIDGQDIIVHIFLAEVREYYQLDSIWQKN